MGSIFHEAYMGLTYVELPDLSLAALQERFTMPEELEQLYKRYEQRFQIGEIFFTTCPLLNAFYFKKTQTKCLLHRDFKC